jgi:hypothetical protein
MCQFLPSVKKEEKRGIGIVRAPPGRLSPGCGVLLRRTRIPPHETFPETRQKGKRNEAMKSHENSCTVKGRQSNAMHGETMHLKSMCGI